MRKHHKLVLTAGVLFGLGTTGVASAADLPVKARPPVVAPVLAYNWSGCYFGGYLGGATPDRSIHANDPTSNGGVFPAGTFYNAPNANVLNAGAFSYNLNSNVIGGGTVGCNWQGAGSSWVVSMEGEGGYMRLAGSVTDPYSLGPLVNLGGDTVASTRVGDWYGSVAGRFGYAWDRVLFYGKAVSNSPRSDPRWSMPAMSVRAAPVC